jgi:MFS family permease
MFTYITTTTVPSFPELQAQFEIDINLANWTVAIPALGLALGPLIWSSPADIIGRRIIFIIGTIMALAATIGAALAPTYSGYMAARFFQGLGVSPASTVGLAVINDLFFEHERGQKIGFWVLAIDVGLYFGPLFGGFIDLVSPQWIQWLAAIFFGVILIAEIAFMPETLYPRERMLALEAGEAMRTATESEKPTVTAVGDQTDLKRTKQLAFINIMPIPGILHPKVWDSLVRFFKLFRFGAVSISVIVFCFSWYWWVLSIITMLPVAYIDFSPQTQG